MREPGSTDDIGRTELARSGMAYRDQIRRSNRRLALAVAAAFGVMAVLPITTAEDRAGILVTALGFAILIVVWFWIVPPRAFADHRIAIFTLLVQPLVVILIMLTGGIDSEYLAYLLMPIVITVYSARRWHTAAAAAGAVASVVLIAAFTGQNDPSVRVEDWVANQTIGVGLFAAFTAVVANTLRTARRNESLRSAELARSESQAKRLAFTDPLTGLFNRYQGDTMLDRFVAEGGQDHGFSVLALDIDDLKRINDTRGHAGGDATIVGVAELLRECLRGMDVPIRTGGDEFVVLLPATNDAQASRVAERIHQALADRNARSPESAFGLSMGSAEWSPGVTATEILARADAALYRAKLAPATA